jgi:hypothetical protein
MVQKNFGKPVGLADLVAARMRRKTPLPPANLMTRPLPNPGGPGSVAAGPTPVRRQIGQGLPLLARMRRRI